MNTDKHGLEKQKSALRSAVRLRLNKIGTEQHRSGSEKLCQKLPGQSFFRDAASVLFFAPLPNEVDLWPVLEQALAGDKIVALPCFDADNRVYRSRRVKNLHMEIVSGRFGIREPASGCVEIPLDDLDLVLVPGVAFDGRGNRLGRGKGFYDRLLQPFKGVKCGIAFEEQIADEIPAENSDVKMNFILTPERLIEIGQ